MRRRTLLVALAGLAVVVAAGAVALWSRADRVTRANYERIQIGMTRADVEAILGPPGDYRSGPGELALFEGDDGTGENMIWMPDPATDIADTSLNWSRMPIEQLEDQRLWATWVSDSFGINISIDGSGGVVGKDGLPRRTTRGALANLLWRANRQWHRWFP
jgi:hypothetical protein